MIRRLIRLTVETGSACAITATVELIFFLILPQTNIHLGMCVFSRDSLFHSGSPFSPAVLS